MLLLNDFNVRESRNPGGCGRMWTVNESVRYVIICMCTMTSCVD